MLLTCTSFYNMHFHKHIGKLSTPFLTVCGSYPMGDFKWACQTGSIRWHKMKISLPNTVSFLFLSYSVVGLHVFFKLPHFQSPIKTKEETEELIKSMKKIYLVPVPQKASILSSWLSRISFYW